MLNEATVVSLRDVGFGYDPDRLLFEHLSTDLVPGTTTAICGPSGRGKSTLLSLIAGLQEPLHGAISGAERLKSSWVLQTPIASSRRSCVDHVTVVYAADRLSWHEANIRARTLLARVGLEESADLPFGKLSGGEAQRLMVARAIAAEPDLMFLDEPTAQLDRAAAASVVAIIHQTAHEGAIVLVATHDQELADSCDARIDL